ncbi:MAG: 3-oxoacyl carrier protein reductase [candidate division TM6 bacterium GW2011_GWF2_30_66]|nr:MAG: 3-oxoacyl carrier protein reductase [candidate division TM6 bacterium GW2011_GWF2_30_66]
MKFCFYLRKLVSIIFIIIFFCEVPVSAKDCVRRAIVVGATSGQGRQVAKLLATEGGYQVGLVSRRLNLLESLSKEIQETKGAKETKTYIKQIDVSNHEQAKELLVELIAEMGGLDLILIAVSSFADFIGKDNKKEQDAKTIAVDLLGFYVAAQVAVEFFENQKSGHLVGISSISGVRGDAGCPVYSGAKAFISRYLEGVRNHMIQSKIPVYITDIVPGWVDIEAAKFSQMPRTYWVTPIDVAARQIFESIQNKDKIAYISRRQIFVKLALQLCPDFIYNAIGGF